MNQRVSAILIVALLISGAATYLVYRVVVSRAAQGPLPATVQVVAAARGLEVGTLIKDSDLKAGSEKLHRPSPSQSQEPGDPD